MQQHLSRQTVRKRPTGHLCRCSVCGDVVWPYPLPLSPVMRLTRGYPRVRAELDRRAQPVRFDPLLWCDACAPPLVVQWWIRWERMAAELLQTLPSIPADVEVPGKANEAEISCNDMPWPGINDGVAVYNRAVLP